METKHKYNLAYVVAALWIILLIQDWFGPNARRAEISYSAFEQHLAAGDVARVAVDERYIRGEYTNPVDGNTGFITPRLEVALADKLAEHEVEFTGVVDDNWFNAIVSWLAPTLLLMLVWFFLFRRFAERQGMGGLMSIGKSRAKVLVEQDTGVAFADVAGVDEAKAELVEVVQFLKEPEHFRRLGAHIPKGVLLVGPPGTGKTLLARAVAGEAKVPFFSISGSEFIEMFVGVGAARVRDLFEQAKLHAPAIIFIDELDALGRARAIGPAYGGHDEREQTLNQLLAEMDGFNTASGVIILAATNRPEILDPALLRAGRFDRQVLVDRPDKTGREQILRVHAKKIHVDPGVDIATVAALTAGFTGADLANLVNEAAIVATRRQGDAVTLDDFVAAVERIVAGLEKRSRVISPEERNIIAHHEMGHALVGMLLNPALPVQKVSVIPRGIGALGYTIQRPLEDRYLMSSGELKNRMAVLLAGRAAEQLVFNEVTTGAADDLVKATDIAQAMTKRYGMTAAIGLLTLEEQKPLFLDVPGTYAGPSYGPETAEKVASAVTALLDDSFGRALTLLRTNRALLEEAALLLVQRETLSEKELNELRTRLHAEAESS